MPSPVFDVQQYELRGKVPAVYTEEQSKILNEVLSRVNGQLDWNAQLLGFNGPQYWGKRIPTTDGTYKWEGLPGTVAEKRAMQATSYGVYNKDKDYFERPAPFNRSGVGASADQIFDIFEEDGKTRVVPFGLPRDIPYEETPRLIVGGEYTFNAIVEAKASGDQDSVIVTQDLSQGITSVRIAGDGSSAILLTLDGSVADPFIFFLEDWEDIADWGSQQILDQFLGLWGNKGSWIASHAMFDALDIHGFSEENSLTLDDVIKELTIGDLLSLVGLEPGPASGLITSHYSFQVEGCDDFYNPTISLETKISALQTQDLNDLETDSGDIISIESSDCQAFVSPAMLLQSDIVDLGGTIIDNGSLEDTQVPDATLNNGEYPGTSNQTVDDSGLFSEPALTFQTEDGKDIAMDDASVYNRPCFLPPDPEFGECSTPNFALTLRQTFDSDPRSISTDPGPEVSTPIGANGVLSLFPFNPSDINNGEYDAPLGQFYLDGGDYDFPVVPTNTVDERIYDRNPYADDPDTPLADYERIIDFDDIVIDIDGQAGPILMSDPGVDNEIVLVASDGPGGEYDGFEIAFDGLELGAVSFEYKSKTSLGETVFPCVEWVFDPTLDNATYFPTPAEAAWMTADDGEFDERPELDFVEYAAQTTVECVNAEFIAGFLAFDDGNYDEQVQPNCIPSSAPSCALADGGPYNYDFPPEPTICATECGTIDNAEYIYDETPFLGPPGIDGLGSAFIDDVCVSYDGEEYDRVVSPEIPCVAYDSFSYDNFREVTCTLADREFFENPPQFSEDQGEYTDDYIATVCTPCGVDLPPPQCYLDNGTIEGVGPSGFEDEGIYDRPEIFCAPCDPEPQPIVPCPVDPVRVRLDQFIFRSLVWRMRPSVANSKTPLRLWKNRTLNVSDPDYAEAYSNQLIADENTSPENVSSYRHFARLPLEYARNSKFWNRALAVLANQSYFSQVLPSSTTALKPLEILPALYDEVYSEASSSIANSAVFYVEDFLISQVSDNNLDPQNGFFESVLTYEDPAASSPFTASTLVDYDPYEARQLRADGSRAGSYLKWSGRCCSLSGYLEDDIARNLLRYTTASEEVLGDSSKFIAPNIEFPDDEDRANFSNYVVSYAYFVADLSAGDEPVFDPDSLYGRREECLKGLEDVSPVLATSNGLILATEDGDLMYGSDEEIVDVCVETRTTYLLHERKPIPARAPRKLGNRAPKSSFVAIEPLEIEMLDGDTETLKVSILTGVDEPYFFRWEALFGPNTAWVNISDGETFSGVTTQELAITPQDSFYDNAMFRVAVDSDLGFTYAVSQPATLKIIVRKITITNQPDDQAVFLYQPAVFAVEAITNDRGTLSYQWQYFFEGEWVDAQDPYDDGEYDSAQPITDSLDNGTYDTFVLPADTVSDDGLVFPATVRGSDTAALTVVPYDPSVSETPFRVLVSSTGGAPSVYSREALLQILAGFITVEGPGDLYLNTREEGFFSVTATTNDGGELSYEWQLDTGSGFLPIPTGKYIGKLFDDGELGEQLPLEEIETEAGRIIETETGDQLGTNFTGSLSEGVDDGFFEGLPFSETLSDETYDQKVSFFPEGPNLRVIALTSDAVGYKVRCLVTSSNTAPPAMSEGTGRLMIMGSGIYVTRQPQDLAGWTWSTFLGLFDNGGIDAPNVPTDTVTDGLYPDYPPANIFVSDDGPAQEYKYGYPQLRDLSNFFVQAYSDDGGLLSYQWQINRNDGAGWRDLRLGEVYDNNEFGEIYTQVDILAETLDEILDEFGRLITTNDTGGVPEPDFDSGEYDKPLAVVSGIFDQDYNTVIETPPDLSALTDSGQYDATSFTDQLEDETFDSEDTVISPTNDSGEYDKPPINTSAVSDEIYDVILSTDPEKSFLMVRPFSKLANDYDFRCIITSNAPLTQGVTTNEVSMTIL